MMLRSLSALAIAACCCGAALGQASLTGSGYSQNFDSMGTGTVAPTGWAFYTFAGTHDLFVPTAPPWATTTTIVGGTANATLIAATPTTQKSTSGYNFLVSGSNRALGTSPSGNAASILQLTLNNATGAAVSSLSVAYDIRRFSTTTNNNGGNGLEELPGYSLFYSLDSGAHWTNVAALNPTLAGPGGVIVPNSVGVTGVPATAITLSGSLAAGANILFRWFDDNAQSPSPDQLLGLDNVVITSAAADPNGRCCFTDGSCGTTTTGSCTTGGTFTSGGVCTTNTCPQPIPGVCCQSDGSCTIATPALPAPTCATGTVVANGTCMPNACPQPPSGSCCAPDGGCTLTIQTACAAGSTWTSAGICSTNTCPVLVVGLPASGYTQNFDSIGQTGTAPPSGWSCKWLSGSHDTFTYAGTLASITTTFLPWTTPTAINVGAGSSVLTTSNTLIVATDPTTQGSGSQFYNLGLSTSAADRCIGSSPTGVAAMELQLSLRNDTGVTLSTLTVGYDIRRFRGTNHNNTGYDASAYASREELPGYSLYVSTDGGASWSNAAEFNPTDNGTSGVVVPASAGVTTADPDAFDLPAAVPPGGTILLRWVDDNAQSTSPDQLIGLDNVSISIGSANPNGSCCFGDGSCLPSTTGTCAAGGSFASGGTCTTNTCPQPVPGVCCQTDGSCTIATPAAPAPTCATGTAVANGTCTTNTCPQPVPGVCCQSDGSCTIATPAAPAPTCATGTAVANGTCTTNTCPQPTSVPLPSHVVIVIEENHSYSEIIGSSNAPYINSLAGAGALLTQSFAITHPSEPNYLAFFSGSTQGVTDDGVYPHSQFTGPNLGAKLLTAGLTFGGYSETQPSVGYDGASSGSYQRKHNPWVNWQDSTVPLPANKLPPAVNMPFAGSFPSDFTTLPALSIVVPNQLNDMHDGSVAQGDTWLQQNLAAYATWCQTHNSLLIVTFDEDDGSQGNRIATILYGQVVTPGQYAENVTHYRLLRTLEDMFGLPHTDATVSLTSVTDVWAPQPGACCNSGACTPAANTGACAGTFQGAGTSCTTAGICPPLSGACCLADGSCTPAANTGACAGAFQGAGSACGTVTCPQPTGACCFGTLCTTTTAAACSGTNKRFAGASIPCNASNNNATPCCKGDFDQSGTLAIADIFAFLNAWFAGDASSDMNGGGLAVSDIFDFLNAWFAGC